jgi:hypothetical protein
MQNSITALFLAAALINLAPVFGALGGERLSALYGVEIAGRELAILMRHRALLFGIVGALLAAAALRPELRAAALLAGLASMLGFLAIARLEGGATGALARVAAADLIGCAALALAGILELAARSGR